MHRLMLKGARLAIVDALLFFLLIIALPKLAAVSTTVGGVLAGVRPWLHHLTSPDDNWSVWRFDGLLTVDDFVTSETTYGPMISEAALRHGLDPALFTAQIKHESRFDPDADGAAGEQGFGQLMPIIRDWCSLSNGYDPYSNLDCAASFMGYLMGKYNSATLALAAYNAGEPAVDACNCVPQNGVTPGYVRTINTYYNEYLSAYASRSGAAADTAVSGPLTQETAVKLLYVSSSPWQTQDWHGLAGWQGWDWKAGCGKPLFSPVPGVATVTYSGFDGYNHVDAAGKVWPQNTMITIRGAGGEVTLLHGDFTAAAGGTVVGGVTQIGTEASNGWSTGCHSHVIVR